MTWMLWLLLAAAPPDLAAVGTVISAQPERNVAVLRSEGRTRVVGVGDSAFGGIVRTVEVGHVVLDFDGERVDLRLPRAQSRPAAAAVAAEPPPAPEEGLTLERRELERRLASESPRILAETTLTPVTTGSQVTGIALSRI